MARPLQHPLHIRTLFYLCGVFVVLPFFDLPLVGLSITAPLMVPLFYYAFFTPGKPWLNRYRGWIMIAAGIWVGMIMSFLANGSWAQARTIELFELRTLTRFLYWLLVFVVTAWIASDFQIQRRLSVLLGASVVVLALVRCFEAFAFGKVGAGARLLFLSQNNYGIGFSTFAPFLFPLLLKRGWCPKILVAGGLMVVLYACALNGSRGSWICIGLGLSIFVFFAVLSRPGTSFRVILPIGLCSLGLFTVLSASTQVREKVLSRLSTMDDLDKDKSYMFRQVMNQKSLKLFKEFPAFGVGPGRYMDVDVDLDMPLVLAKTAADTFRNKSPHNAYLSYLAEGGMLGVLPLALLLGILAARGAWAAIGLNRQGESWALGIYSGFLSMSIHLWVLAGLTSTSPWFIYGLLVATIFLAAQGRKRPRALSQAMPAPNSRRFRSGRPQHSRPVAVS